eukprot:3517609-Pyramimonas_sp.AAC.1
MCLRSASSISSSPHAKEASRGVQDRGRPASPGTIGGPPSALSPARDMFSSPLFPLSCPSRVPTGVRPFSAFARI